MAADGIRTAPTYARDERVGTGYDGAAEEAVLVAVVAHGLFGPIAVLRGAAFAVRDFGGSLSGTEYVEVIDAVISQSEVLTEGLDSVLRYCSARFADAAWVVESVGRSYRGAPTEDHRSMFDQLDAAAEVLSDELRSLVQGLPSEARALLDQLRDPTLMAASQPPSNRAEA